MCHEKGSDQQRDRVHVYSVTNSWSEPFSRHTLYIIYKFVIVVREGVWVGEGAPDIREYPFSKLRTKEDQDTKPRNSGSLSFIYIGLQLDRELQSTWCIEGIADQNNAWLYWIFIILYSYWLKLFASFIVISLAKH